MEEVWLDFTLEGACIQATGRDSDSVKGVKLLLELPHNGSGCFMRQWISNGKLSEVGSPLVRHILKEISLVGIGLNVSEVPSPTLHDSVKVRIRQEKKGLHSLIIRYREGIKPLTKEMKATTFKTMLNTNSVSQIVSEIRAITDRLHKMGAILVGRSLEAGRNNIPSISKSLSLCT